MLPIAGLALVKVGVIALPVLMQYGPRLLRILPNCSSVIQSVRTLAGNPRVVHVLVYGTEYSLKYLRSGVLTIRNVANPAAQVESSARVTVIRALQMIAGGHNREILGEAQFLVSTL